MSSSRGPTAAFAGVFAAGPDPDPFGGFLISSISFLANTSLLLPDCSAVRTVFGFTMVFPKSMGGVWRNPLLYQYRTFIVCSISISRSLEFLFFLRRKGAESLGMQH